MSQDLSLSPSLVPAASPCGEGVWLCALSAPQPGIGDLEEEKGTESWWLTLGTLGVPFSKDRSSAGPRATEPQPQKASREVAGLALRPGPGTGQELRDERGTAARQLRSCGLMEKEVRPGGRRRWPSSLYPLLPAGR